MLSNFHHFAGNVRSTTNSRSMKKLCFGSSLLLTLLNYRNFLTPLGFASDEIINFRLGDLVFKDAIEQIRVLIDAHPNDTPLLTLKHNLQNIVLSSISDQTNMERVSAIIQLIFDQSIFDDGFSIVKHSEKSSIWQFPNDVPISSFTPIMQNLPHFGDPLATGMLEKGSYPIQKYHLSYWISRPFVLFENYHGKIVLDRAIQNIEAILQLLPTFVGTGDEKKFEGPIGQYLLWEVTMFNSALRKIKNSLERMSEELNSMLLSYQEKQITKTKDEPIAIDFNQFSKEKSKNLEICS